MSRSKHFVNGGFKTSADSEAGILAAPCSMYGVLVPHWPPSAIARDAARRVDLTLHEAHEVVASLIETEEPWADSQPLAAVSGCCDHERRCG